MRIIRIDDFFFKLSLLLFVIIAVIHVGASLFDWYYIFPELDVPVHILGGMMIGFWVLAFIPESFSVIKKLIWIIGIVMLVGVGVEVFEWIIDTFIRTNSYRMLQPNSVDTYNDLLNDFIGGMLAFCFAYLSKRI